MIGMMDFIDNKVKDPLFEYSSILSGEKSIIHFFTTRTGGSGEGKYASFNLGMYCNDNPATVIKNRKILCNKIGIDEERLIIPNETHSANVKKIDSDFFGLPANKKTEYFSECDALLTNVKGVCLGVTTADCVPVLLYDKKTKSVAAVHAGWRGIVKKIIPATIQKMADFYASDPINILAAIGPCISNKNYEVSEELIENFKLVFNSEIMSQITETTEGKFYIDLRKAAYYQCFLSRIPHLQIEIHPHCTYKMPDLYFSARRDSFNCGRMLSGIMLT